MARGPRVVAELGRPETPAETAARKAQGAADRRRRQTVTNLLGSLFASLAVVLVIVLIVPRSDTPIEPDIDVASVAEQAAIATSETLAVPELPEGWRANAAELRTSGVDGVTSWYVGYLTPGDEYIGMYQAFDANPTWVAETLERTLAAGVTEVDGVEWTVYDNRDTLDDVGNARYGLVTEAGGSTFVLLGTGTDDEFRTIASEIAPTVVANLP
ncbi:hypothetical protein ARHIZOSPH14_25720 [Agromyces rhizosphaerae]|uniref:DUF4245 family protein n=1 Tax=Agromyces rhizosphaerae TaxID=88374 RepID=A0A9W6CXV8_9MICO|nr:DUF4245 domain-containing protein [Agromyces rhizosphaerae]GLI28330.1 hypothetical protein ARHIZOSPH14_25720 [Agromyces rhizosphaerae]